jgi:hypothetical protein
MIVQRWVSVMMKPESRQGRYIGFSPAVQFKSFMGTEMLAADERVADVSFDQDALSVRLKDGRTISVPLGAPS